MKRRQVQDTRPHWSDPDLPCIRDYRMSNGIRKTEVDPDYERRYREFLLGASAHLGFRDDPTYDLRRK